MTKIKETLVAKFGNPPHSKAKNLYQFIDAMPLPEVAQLLTECGNEIGKDIMPKDSIMRKSLKTLAKFYLFNKKIPSLPGLKLDIVKVHTTEQVISFEYKGRFYIYKYKTDNRSGLAYVYRGINELIYGPYPKQCTDEGKEVYDAIWSQVIAKKTNE